jgi:hypothetical protein
MCPWSVVWGNVVVAAMSSLKLHDDCSSLDRDTVGPLPAPNAMPAPWGGTHMPYSGTYLPHTGTGYAPMPFNYTNEPSVYGYAREESVHSGSGKLGRRSCFIWIWCTESLQPRPPSFPVFSMSARIWLSHLTLALPIHLFPLHFNSNVCSTHSFHKPIPL